MFDVGFWELALISVVALIIIGPERLPGAAHTAGLWVGKARRMLRDAKADIDRELREQNTVDVAALKKDIEDAGGQFKEAATTVSEAATTVGAVGAVGADAADIKPSVEQAAASVKQSFEEAAPLNKDQQPASAKKSTAMQPAAARRVMEAPPSEVRIQPDPLRAKQKNKIYQAGISKNGGSIKGLAKQMKCTPRNIQLHIQQCKTKLGFGYRIEGDHFKIVGAPTPTETRQKGIKPTLKKRSLKKKTLQKKTTGAKPASAELTGSA